MSANIPVCLCCGGAEISPVENSDNEEMYSCVSCDAIFGKYRATDTLPAMTFLHTGEVVRDIRSFLNENSPARMFEPALNEPIPNLEIEVVSISLTASNRRLKI